MPKVDPTNVLSIDQIMDVFYWISNTKLNVYTDYSIDESVTETVMLNKDELGNINNIVVAISNKLSSVLGKSFSSLDNSTLNTIYNNFIDTVNNKRTENNETIFDVNSISLIEILDWAIKQIGLKNDISTNWTSNNPVLAKGELAIETDTNQFKIGDGVTEWNSLDYWTIDTFSGSYNDLEDKPTSTITEIDNAVTNSHEHTNKDILDNINESFTSELKTNYNSAYTHSQEDHASVNAEENQNAFSTINDITADSKTSTVSIVSGSPNIVINNNNASKTITLSIDETNLNADMLDGYDHTDIPILNSEKKIPLTYMPDLSANTTYVVLDSDERNNIVVSEIKSGDKSYETSTGDTYIWDGSTWQIMARADWENINLEWSNINNKPTSTITEIDNAVTNSHTHTNKDILDGILNEDITNWDNKEDSLGTPIQNGYILSSLTDGTRQWIANIDTSDKVTKVIPSDTNNIAGLDVDGNLIDLNAKISDFSRVYNDESVAGTFEQSSNQKILITKNSPGEDGDPSPSWANENDIIFVYEENI